ncbi:MAG: phosphatidylserine decarboxylase family protein [Balneolaceae bacterium]
MVISREGYSTILLVVILLLLTIGAYWALGSTFLLLSTGLLVPVLLLVIYFFRDPERSSPQREDIVLSPADGRVVSIQEVEEKSYMKSSAIRISIFLSPLDVHVNRIPVSGDIEFVEYRPGGFSMAWKEHASEGNEQAIFGVRHEMGKRFLFRQITGFLARRIVYHLEEGDRVLAGERFGIMKFGSRMDILVPPETRLAVRTGERVWAGETILATIDE